MGVRVLTGDITEFDCECIVNAANKSLLGGGGVDGAIHRKAGEGLLEECKKLGGCETGEAKITKGYNTNANYIIHTVGPVYGKDIAPQEKLKNCYFNSLELAKKNDIHQIAFPAISTGIYGYPFEEATEIAIRTIEYWLVANTDYAMDVMLVFFTPEQTKKVTSVVLKIYR